MDSYSIIRPTSIQLSEVYLYNVVSYLKFIKSAVLRFMNPRDFSVLLHI